MQSIKHHILIISSLLLGFVSLKNCTNRDTSTLDIRYDERIYKKLIQDKEVAAVQYEAKIRKLELKADSLQKIVVAEKRSLEKQKLKAKISRQALTKVLDGPDSLLTKADSIMPLIVTYMTESDQRDSLCDNLVSDMEVMISNRDSSISIHRQLEQSQRHLSLEQQLRIDHLTNELNLAYKAQKRKSRQNRIMAGGIMILSGITTSLLITNSLK